MNFSYISLDPVPVSKPGPHAAKELRTHQGIPGIECSASGRLFAVWYAGGNGECRENYVTMAVSDDHGATWKDSVAVVDPPHPDVRAFDSVLWRSPDGRFFWFWSQGCGGADGSREIYDGIGGVWCSVLENPDDDPENFRFTLPRRISNGIMMNKPTVLGDGTWAFPCSLWTGDSRRHDSLGVVPGAMMVTSSDGGETFSVRGRVDMRNVDGGPLFDEHQFVELHDGRILCAIRVRKGVAESFSSDGGYTWSDPVLSETIHGPNSRFFLRRLKSGRLLLVNNDSSVRRERMTASLSEDDGRTWPYHLLLYAPEGVSYPDGCEYSDGHLALIYDFDRSKGGYIFLSRITEEDLLAGRLVSPDSVLNLEVSHSRPVSRRE